ncbi:hypothetical protein TPL01_11530 [Sulfuriferula plumbiphila]|uniref:Glycosyltransferase 2-like domain-containing protein n=1 Tax=Sulfuriferula plumbiphila TaxID=171865 RepID=A0A512L6B2_9PROT|nr:glycosyltransferase [Sulfuriferula plumbiphila]BBP03614.1 hypothetical protein SFPGR_10360 [Sulfuriferula plumbiphila]GEP30015.1 hypothetical protein TPL01_11530 [Sulfuriferula plumbiphila]
MTQYNNQVDVIILSWNRVDDTIAAIASTNEQVDVDKRILIVDQGSESENLRRIEHFLRDIPCAELNKLGKNVGVAGGRNIAAGMGNAPYIVALDSDAVFADSRMLARAVAHMDAAPQLCAIGFRIVNFFNGENDATSWDYPAAGCHPDKRFATTRFIGAGHAIRRSTFESVGAYDERLFFCGEEIDLCYRMLNTGLRIEYVPEIAIRHKVAPEHRVFWGKGRYFYTVRNSMYTKYKYGESTFRLGAAALAFLIKGYANRIPGEALRAFKASFAMCRAFKNSVHDKHAYQLSAETRSYILSCEPWRKDGVFSKLRRQFVGLPHQD